MSRPADDWGALKRAYISMERRAARMLFGTGFIVRLLAKKRRAPVQGRVLDEHIAAMLRLDDFTGDSVVTGYTPAQARQRVARSIAIVDGDSPEDVSHEDLEADIGSVALRLRAYTPAGERGTTPGVVFIHGGGWVTGDLNTHDGACRRLAHDARCRVVSVEYRLAPEHPFPTPMEDAVGAFRWIGKHADDLKLDPERLAVMGDSAGGNLSAVISLHTRGDAVKPALQVPVYPATDARLGQPSHEIYGKDYFLTREAIDWYYGHYASDADRENPDVSPLLSPDVSGSPPALIVPAGFDPLLDEGVEYGERLRAAGVPTRTWVVDTMPHGFLLMTGVIPEAARVCRELNETVGRVLRGEERLGG